MRRKWGKRTAGAKERKFRDENGMVRCDERQRQLETFTAVHLESNSKQDGCYCSSEAERKLRYHNDNNDFCFQIFCVSNISINY